MNAPLLVGIADLFFGAVTQGYAERGVPTLVFSFPDGVRGGRGKIQGTGQRSKNEANGPDYLLSQIKKCGAIEAAYSDVQVSHRISILSKSTSKNYRVVKCVKRSVPSHFSAWVQSFDPAYPRVDDTPFSKLWTIPVTLPFQPESKAN